jgi:hypothetical protein
MIIMKPLSFKNWLFCRLGVLAALIAATAYADEIRTGGARVIENPTQDGNLVLRVNDGGVKKDAITVTGSTADVTIGSGNFVVPTTGASVNTGTTDAADNKRIYFAGGGAASDTRGAFIEVNGNEGPNPADIHLYAGNVVGGNFEFVTGGNTRVTIVGDSGTNPALDLPRANLRIGDGAQSSTARVGMYIELVGGGASCTSECQNQDAAGSNGFDSDSGVCLQAWLDSTGAVSTCGDTTGGKICMCAGAIL